MDALLAEISAKKSAMSSLHGGSGFSSNGNGNAAAGPSKYMRRAEVEAAQEEAERRKREAAREKLRAEKEARAAKGKRGEEMKKDAEQARHASLTRLAGSPAPGSSGAGTPEPDARIGGGTDKEYNISSTECIRRLRAKGQPIRYFGETDKDRRSRLRQLELGADDRNQGVKADEFWRTLKGVEKGLLEKDAEGQGSSARKRKAAETGENKEGNGQLGGDGGGIEGAAGRKDKKRVDVDVIDMKVIKDDLNKAYPLVYWAFKNVYKEWEEWMDARPEEIKRSTQGKLALATQVQSGVNLKPLFKQLRSRDMPPDLIYKLAELVHHTQLRQYQRANDAYLRLSIGNAAWPIGVTSVGLHERGAREKITEDTVAHVLNDEVSRKWIQAVKRLLTFSQMVRPPKDASQAMG